MAAFSRMPRHDIRNDGAGPYAIFFCDNCGQEFHSQPDVANTLTQDFGRQALGECCAKYRWSAARLLIM